MVEFRNCFDPIHSGGRARKAFYKLRTFCTCVGHMRSPHLYFSGCGQAKDFCLGQWDSDSGHLIPPSPVALPQTLITKLPVRR